MIHQFFPLFQNFKGNKNQYAVVTNKIANPFEAVAVRILPTDFYGRIALRIELYGCDIKWSLAWIVNNSDTGWRAASPAFIQTRLKLWTGRLAVQV